jgi:hypothetical protein
MLQPGPEPSVFSASSLAGGRDCWTWRFSGEEGKANFQGPTSNLLAPCRADCHTGRIPGQAQNHGAGTIGLLKSQDMAGLSVLPALPRSPRGQPGQEVSRTVHPRESTGYNPAGHAPPVSWVGSTRYGRVSRGWCWVRVRGAVLYSTRYYEVRGTVRRGTEVPTT